jgi:hypothetical protein
MKRNYLKCLLIWDSETHGSLIACKDGKFRRSVSFGTCSSCCKFWKTEGYARRYARLKGLDSWTIKFIREGDSIDHLANVTNTEGTTI